MKNSPPKSNRQSTFSGTTQRIFVRFWVAPFYILVVFPYIVLASQFGDSGENLIYWIVNFLNGNPGSVALIDATDIIRATATLFVVINLAAEIFLRISYRNRTGGNYKTSIMVRLAFCVVGWLLASAVTLAKGQPISDAIFFVIAATGSSILFLAEFLVRRVLNRVFITATELVTIVNSSRKI